MTPVLPTSPSERLRRLIDEIAPTEAARQKANTLRRAIEAAAVATERARLRAAVEAIDPDDYVDTRTALNVRAAVLALLEEQP